LIDNTAPKVKKKSEKPLRVAKFSAAGLAVITLKVPPGRTIRQIAEGHAVRGIRKRGITVADRPPHARNAKKPRGTPRGFFGYYLRRTFDQ